MSGCAVDPSRRTFQASPEQLLEAVKWVLGHCPDVEQEGNVIRTGFCPQPISPEIRQFGLAWREKHKVQIEGSLVEVTSLVEETGLHGHSRHQWVRKDSQRVEEAILDAIERRLGGRP